MVRNTSMIAFVTLCASTSLASADEVDPLVAIKTDEGLISLTKAAPGLTPVSDYTGDILDRSTALGDLLDRRQSLYEMGITIDAELTQVIQGIASGGPDGDNPDTRYSGLADYGVTLDTAKLGLWSGGLFVANAQTSWGNSLLGDTGTISPNNFLSIYPLAEDDKTVLMEYYLSQALPGNLGLVLGRVNGANFIDRNRFANDPRNQFLNLSLSNNPLLGEFLSFSTYAGLLSVPVTEGLKTNFAIWDPNAVPDDYPGGTDGFFDEVGAGVEVDFSWTLGNGLDGAFRPAFLYSSADITDLDNQSLVLDLITGQQLDEVDDTYLFHFNAEQYFWKPDTPTTAAKPVRTADYDFQERGAGVFVRGGYVPDDRSIFDLFLSGGVGGRGVFESRPYDRFGVGFYWLREGDEFDDLPGRLLQDETGIEAFYNFAVTPWATVSGDIQWVDSALIETDDSVIMGARLNLQF